MTTDPMWLKIALGMVPLIAAAIAGFFALRNSQTQRVDRLKTLVELRKDVPQHVNPLGLVDTLILRELRGLDRASDANGKNANGLMAISLGVLAIGYAAAFFELIDVISPAIAKLVAIPALLVTATVAGFALKYARRRHHDVSHRYNLGWHSNDKRWASDWEALEKELEQAKAKPKKPQKDLPDGDDQSSQPEDLESD